MGNEMNNNNLNEINEINFGHFQIFSEELKDNLLLPLNKLEDKISNDLNEIDNFIHDNKYSKEEQEQKNINEKSFEENDDENIDTNVKYAESKKKIRDFINKINFENEDSEKFVNDFSKEIIHANNTREILFKILMN